MIFIAPSLLFLVAVFGLPMVFVLATRLRAERGQAMLTLEFFARFFSGEIYLRVLMHDALDFGWRNRS